MSRFTWAIAVVCLCVLGPIGVIAGLRALPPEILAVAKDFQTLIGASVALGAAVIAFTNVGLQITAARRQEEEKRRFEQLQTASALSGELKAFAAVATGRNMVAYYEQNAAHVRQSGRFAFWSLALSSEYDRVFRAVGDGIGRLPGDLPEQVVGAYAQITSVFDRMKAAERGDYNGLGGDAAVTILTVLAAEADAAIKLATRSAQLLDASRRAA
ncbi:MAG: hypothetical protein JO048_10870 [Methylobacteriaceae bacterium]|nr:hypothetical protein [Methylobacteriaceae bacterium]